MQDGLSAVQGRSIERLQTILRGGLRQWLLQRTERVQLQCRLPAAIVNGWHQSHERMPTGLRTQLQERRLRPAQPVQLQSGLPFIGELHERVRSSLPCSLRAAWKLHSARFVCLPERLSHGAVQRC